MIVQSGPAMKTRNTECQKQRPEGTWGGKQWAEVKWGDGQSINKDKNKSQALMKGTVAMLLICVTEIC